MTHSAHVRRFSVQVRPGENTSAIARRVGLSAAALLTANPTMPRVLVGDRPVFAALSVGAHLQLPADYRPSTALAARSVLGDQSCPDGQEWSWTAWECVDKTPDTSSPETPDYGICPDGFHRNFDTWACDPDGGVPAGCPSGQVPLNADIQNGCVTPNQPCDASGSGSLDGHYNADGYCILNSGGPGEVADCGDDGFLPCTAANGSPWCVPCGTSILPNTYADADCQCQCLPGYVNATDGSNGCVPATVEIPSCESKGRKSCTDTEGDLWCVSCGMANNPNTLPEPDANCDCVCLPGFHNLGDGAGCVPVGAPPIDDCESDGLRTCFAEDGKKWCVKCEDDDVPYTYLDGNCQCQCISGFVPAPPGGKGCVPAEAPTPVPDCTYPLVHLNNSSSGPCVMPGSACDLPGNPGGGQIGVNGHCVDLSSGCSKPGEFLDTTASPPACLCRLGYQRSLNGDCTLVGAVAICNDGTAANSSGLCPDGLPAIVLCPNGTPKTGPCPDCPIGQIKAADGITCVPFLPAQQFCPNGMPLTAAGCPSGPAPCPGGTSRTMMDTCPEPTCPPGQSWNGTVCLVSPLPQPCPAGQTWNGSQCSPGGIVPVKSCPDGFPANADGSCTRGAPEQPQEPAKTTNPWPWILGGIAIVGAGAIVVGASRTPPAKRAVAQYKARRAAKKLARGTTKTTTTQTVTKAR